ncbi:hypothetical protein FAX13_06095 [Ligilactobacillus animalis]|nr:hypothetical protein FAX13_06095 [Ligilactobacillus animalis]
MTVEELAERIREYKRKIRGITVEDACGLNEIYNNGKQLGWFILLDTDQAKLSEIILGGDTD